MTGGTDMTGVNSAQAEAWNGYEGEHWAANDTRYDAVNEGFNAALLAAAAIGQNDRVLDVGCGNGQLTRLAARQARQGRALGIDLSRPMLARARACAAEEGLGNVAFEQADAQTCPLRAGEFDVAISRFGIMFFADPVAAFANIGRAVRPGGRLAFVSMADPAGTDMGAVFGALASQLPATASTGGASPLSLADPAQSSAVLTAAGFSEVACRHIEAEQVWGSDVADAVAFITGWGPVRFGLDQVEANVAARAKDALTAALRPFATPAGVRLRGTAWLVSARRPGA